MKNKINKIKISFLLVVILQIFLLMNMGIADSYFIHQTDKIIDKEKNMQQDENNLINTGINLLIGILSIKQIGRVSASDYALNCCLNTTSGAICQDVLSTTPEQCNENLLPTKCESTTGCESGCCFDSNEGLCSMNSPKKKCEDEDGQWDSDASCSISECQKGCCVLGTEAQFVTETRCSNLSSYYGYTKDFRDISTEVECLALSASEFKGACIYNDETCSIETEADCLSYSNNNLINVSFHEGYLCSNPSLDTNCTKQASIGCYSDEDEIYWFDSCGNIENIYSSDTTASWNNGMMLSKEDSCNYGSSNADSTTCGNCDYYLGSMCSKTNKSQTSVEDGDYVCKDVNCVDEKGQSRYNGESWCVYDSYIGDGKDTVGSRHWKRYCIDGEVKVEPCSDYRGQVCAQSEITEGSDTFSIASCVINEAQLCIGYNDDASTMTEECNDNTHCMIKSVHVDKYFKFDICVARYPRGFNLTSSSLSCSIGTNTCTVYFQKNWLGEWECEENCDCIQSGDDPSNLIASKTFVKQMNDVCISLGDCGSYVNYIGKGTDNIAVTGNPTDVSWEDYIKYAKPVSGQYVEPQSADDFMSSFIGESGTYDADEKTKEKTQKLAESIGKISGGLGVATLGIMAVTGKTLTFTSGIIGSGSGSLSITSNTWATTFSQGSSATVNVGGAFAAAAIGAAIGGYLGAYLAKTLGRTGDAATALVIGGAIGGAVIALYYFSSACTVGPWGCIVGAIVAALIIIWTWASGWGKSRERTVTFTCMPWEAPVGGEYCERCNDDILSPCTSYKCESLGQACVLLNEDEENPVCQSIEYETTPPVISAGEVLTTGYDFFSEKKTSVEVRQDDKSCIQEFTDVSFTLETDEYAQCKYAFQRASNYDNMSSDYPLEQNSFTLNHTFNFSMPSIDSLEVYNISGDLEEMYGDMNMYVRCQDYHGNYNIKEYTVNFCINSGPDLTAPKVVSSSIQDGDYLKYNVTETSLLIYVNEPAECYYDNLDMDYENMENAMSCKTELTAQELNGWRCETNLTNLTSNSNSIYIRCKDQPWENETENRNTNSESYSFTIYKTQYQLSIDSVLPDGEIESGFEPVAVDLEVRTSGGVDNGVSDCYYKWAGSWVQFFDTSSSYHKQESLNLMGGNFTIPLKCEDAYENIDYENISFMISVDSSPPVVINTSYEEDDLKLTTDEDAECYYDLETCYFDIDNSTSMTTSASTEHTIHNLNSRENYYVKCQDVWENSNPDCAIIINATETNDYTAPVAVRIYKKGSELTLITNELAECYYDLYTCSFDINNATSMTTEFSTEHSAAWNNGQTYYIQCIDDWDNSGCAITVNANNLEI